MMFSYGLLYIDVLVLANEQRWLTYICSGWTLEPRRPTGMNGKRERERERESGNSVLSV